MDTSVIGVFIAGAIPITTVGVTLIAKAVQLKAQVDAHEKEDEIIHSAQTAQLTRIENKIDHLTEKLIPQASHLR